MSYLIANYEQFMLSSPLWYQCEWNDWTYFGSNPIQQGQALTGAYKENILFLGIDPIKPAERAKSMFEIIYFQIWLMYKNLDVGLITMTKYYDFYIWNAYFSNVNLTNIEKIDLDGLYYTDDITGIFSPLQEKDTLIKVSQEGSPIIDGHFAHIFDVDIYYLYISGLRVIPIPLTHFICDRLNFKLSFSIAVAVNMFLKEQRRLLVDKPLKSVNGSIFIDRLGSSNIINLLDQYGGRIVACSIPFEKLTPVAENLYGLKNIYVEENISQYSEIDTCPLLLVYYKDTGKAYCYEIINIDKSNKLITLKLPIDRQSLKNNIELYPAFFAIIESVTNTAKIGKYTIADVSFQEVYN
jgi:hypothetical protein